MANNNENGGQKAGLVKRTGRFGDDKDPNVGAGTQFKKGQVPNPNGRPKGKSLSKTIQEMLNDSTLIDELNNKIADELRQADPDFQGTPIVGKAMRNGAVEGQTDSISSIWGKNVIIGYITPTPGLRTVNGGYTLRLRDGKYVDKWDDRDPKGTWVRNNDYYDQMLFASELFYLIKNAVA